MNFGQDEDWKSSSSSTSEAKALILSRSLLTGEAVVLCTTQNASVFLPSVIQPFSLLRIFEHSSSCSFSTGLAQAFSVRAVDLFLRFQWITNMNAQMQIAKSLHIVICI